MCDYCHSGLDPLSLKSRTEEMKACNEDDSDKAMNSNSGMKNNVHKAGVSTRQNNTHLKSHTQAASAHSTSLLTVR